MKAKMFNTTTLAGLLYDYDLEEKETGPNSKSPGTKYIRGKISIATDAPGEEITNVVDVHYTYVAPTTSKGENSVYKELKKILNKEYKSVMTDGKDLATILRISSSFGLNDFYTNDRETGEEKLVSVPQNQGGFITVINKIPEKASDRNEFNVDMVITGVRHVDEDTERELPEKVILKGCVFDFRKAMLPIEFSVKNTRAMDYFEESAISSKSPMFTHLRGTQVSQTVKRNVTIEGAWGDEVREVARNYKDLVITWAAKEPYEWDDESTLMASELKDAMANREIYLAEIKSRRDEYLKTKETTKIAKEDSFDFGDF